MKNKNEDFCLQDDGFDSSPFRNKVLATLLAGGLGFGGYFYGANKDKIDDAVDFSEPPVKEEVMGTSCEEKIVYKDRVVYKDKVVEVPVEVEKIVEVEKVVKEPVYSNQSLVDVMARYDNGCYTIGNGKGLIYINNNPNYHYYFCEWSKTENKYIAKHIIDHKDYLNTRCRALLEAGYSFDIPIRRSF